MQMDPTIPAQPNGLKTALDTIVAPKDAFERLRTAPTWGWAFLLALVLFALGSYLLEPAIIHATQTDWPNAVAASPALSQLPADRQQHYLELVLKIVAFNWVFAIVMLPIAILIQTIIMLVFNAIGRGSASFASLWAASANIIVASLGLGTIAAALLVMLRGADTFDKALDVQTAMPSLALLAPGATAKLHAFLGAFTPFSLWGCALIAMAMMIIARVPRTLAWTTGIAMLLVGGGLFALGAK
jgi:hypothetical protein